MSDLAPPNPEQTNQVSNNSAEPNLPEEKLPKPGPVSNQLLKKNLDHTVLEPDHLGIEMIGIKPNLLKPIASFLKEDGFDYLQCQGGYDEGPGKELVCFYHLIAMGEIAENDYLESNKKLREIRLKVFLSREGTPSIPSLYEFFKGADWQERETFDMFGIHFEGHPHPKRLLMPEDWEGWPLRKDYIQPNFYEMQDAY